MQEGPYIFDIPFFNKEVIREAINNAIAHRDYNKTSETVIKQFPQGLYIINPGGFPLGVTLENLLTVNSTPRNRLLADVLSKIGVVESAGQGIDKIYYQTLTEAKPEPDYSHSDNFQVELRLSSIIEDKAFALFIKTSQGNRKDSDKLSVQEVVALNHIRKGVDQKHIKPDILIKLERDGLIESIGKTKAKRYILPKSYFILNNLQADYSSIKSLDNDQLILLMMNHLRDFTTAKLGDFEKLLRNFVQRHQVKYLVNKLVTQKIFDKIGSGKGTYYQQGEFFLQKEKLLSRAVELGLEEMKRRGEIENH